MKVCKKDFPMGSFKGQRSAGFYIDGILKDNLDPMVEVIGKDMFFTFLVTGSGMIRVGKSFGKETKVKIIENGKIKESKNLGSYKEGDILNTVSWNFKNNKIAKSKSTVIKNKDKRKLYTVELENGQKIRCSKDHKLFVKRKFCDTNDKLVSKVVELKLKDIKEGDELVCHV